MKKKLLRLIKWACLVGLVALIVVIVAWRMLLPSPIERTEIFHGIHYVSEKIEGTSLGKGRMMGFEIQLDAPGVEFFIRPLDPEAVEDGSHYVLRSADLEVMRHDLAVLVNGSRYFPEEWWRSYPGARVRSLESLVLEGKLTHMHEHSYLLWFDETLTAHVETEKPPPAQALEKARWGVGLQGLQVIGGEARYGALGNREDVIMRPFIGVDPGKKKLWLLVFEAVSGDLMADKAVEMGVKVGGQMDAGNGTWGIIGPGAKGVTPWTAIRGGRPLGCYLGFRAEPLP